MITSRQNTILRRLALGPKSAVELSDEDLKTVLDLVSRGLAYDYAGFKGRRIPINLRLWGITTAGKALLAQQSLVDSSTRQQPSLNLAPKPIARIKPSTGPTPSRSPTLNKVVIPIPLRKKNDSLL